MPRKSPTDLAIAQLEADVADLQRQINIKQHAIEQLKTVQQQMKANVTK